MLARTIYSRFCDPSEENRSLKILTNSSPGGALFRLAPDPHLFAL